MAETARLAKGIPIYAPPSDGGFSGATYGPLYYLVGSHLVDPGRPSYLPLRVLSAIAILGCSFGCGLLAFWLTRSWLVGWLSPLVFLAYGIVTFHGASALSDNVALFLSFAGFLIAYRFRDSRGILFAAPLMVLGFYYKQQFVAGSLAVLLYLLFERNYVRAAQFAGLLAVCGTGLFVLFQSVIFSGQEFWRHFLFYQAPLFSWEQWKLGLTVFTLILGPPVLLAFEFLREHRDRLLLCYLVCAVLLGVITIGKATGFMQYFYESILAVSVLVPALLGGRLAKRSGAREVLFLFTLAVVAGQWYTPPAPNHADVAQYNALESFLRHTASPGSRALGFRGGDLVQAGFDTPFADLFQTELLSRRGIASDECLLTRIRDRWFSVIVLDSDLRETGNARLVDMYLTERARELIEQNYIMTGQIGVPSPERLSEQDRFYIYVPRRVRGST